MPIVTATAAFAKRNDLARRIENAMSGAALQAHSEGETDPAAIKRQMMAARARVLAVRDKPVGR